MAQEVAMKKRGLVDLLVLVLFAALVGVLATPLMSSVQENKPQTEVRP